MTRLWALLPVVSLIAGAAPTPVLSGLYSLGEVGIVEFTSADGKAIGKLKTAHQCSNLSLNETVVSGSFEGDVFVGVVTICQEGARCESKRTYPILGIHRGDEVSAFVHLDEGCSSAALDNRGIVFKPASLEEKQKIVGSSSASSVAQKNKNPGTDPAVDLMIEGQRLLGEHKPQQAKTKMKQALMMNDQLWPAHFGLGVALIELNQPGEALPSLDRALTLSNGESAEYVAQIHYNRACALAMNAMRKEALAALRMSVKLGGSVMATEARTDSNLKALREMPEFQRLLDEGKKKSNR